MRWEGREERRGRGMFVLRGGSEGVGWRCFGWGWHFGSWAEGIGGCGDVWGVGVIGLGIARW